MTKGTVKKDILSGIWKSRYDWGSVAEYRIERNRRGYTVSVRDSEDGEHADVLETKWDAARHILAISVYWNSSGRFLRCRFKSNSASQIELTYTYPDTEVLERTPTKRA